jgi:peptidoglycan-N-acetylglucosamine deacetylase
MPSFLLTIDVEDWFQVENLRPWIPFSTWDSRELRVEANVNWLLDLFDSFKLPELQTEDGHAPCAAHPAPPSLKDNPVNPAGKFSGSAPRSNPTNSTNPKSPTNRSLRATFFVLGWVAKRLPHLVREIAARGHEVASHGFNHQMCKRLSKAELREELDKSKRLLEGITGTEVSGFRAPNFSIDDRVLSMLQETGYRYDSSFNNFSLHGRYGKISLNGQPRIGKAYKMSEGFFEIPVSNLSLATLVTLGTRNFSHFPLPWSGGAYFRLMPLSMFSMGVRSILKSESAYVFYMHPWEIDSGQPRVEQASMFARFKHYANLATTREKLKRMVEQFACCHFANCGEYIKALNDPVVEKA